MYNYLLSIPLYYTQYIEEVEDRSQDEMKGKRSMLGVSGVHVQTFNVFKQANDFSEAPRPVRVSHSRSLKEVRYDCVMQEGTRCLFNVTDVSVHYTLLCCTVLHSQ